MIDLHFWPTPNGYKVLFFLEEAGVDYTLRPIDIASGAQFEPEFLRISPNNRMPAIVDHDPAHGGGPQSVFESGAILLYLAEKTGRFLPADPRARIQALEWLFWQMGGLGPMLGQRYHFTETVREKLAYPIERYTTEAARLLGVLDRHLEGRAFIAGEDYSIADMACQPWLEAVDLEGRPNLARWHAAIEARPSTRRAYEVGEPIGETSTVSEADKNRVLYGQTGPA